MEANQLLTEVSVDIHNIQGEFLNCVCVWGGGGNWLWFSAISLQPPVQSLNGIANSAVQAVTLLNVIQSLITIQQ